jgi:hypothetical protein
VKIRLRLPRITALAGVAAARDTGIEGRSRPTRTALDQRQGRDRKTNEDVRGRGCSSVRHALVNGWPILPILVFVPVPLLLAVGPFGGVLGPLLFRRIPLSSGPVLDLRRHRRFRWLGRCSGRGPGCGRCDLSLRHRGAGQGRGHKYRRETEAGARPIHVISVVHARETAAGAPFPDRLTIVPIGGQGRTTIPRSCR